MGIADDIRVIPNGAGFQRVDLHVHSFGVSGSECVTDSLMTPAAIVAAAVLEGIAVVGITDHNSIGNVEAALAAAQDTTVLVLPGVELATVQGHLLVYFETFEHLSQFYGKLEFDRGTCRQTIVQCLESADARGGFGIAAHIHTEAGFENRVPGYGDAKRMIVTNPSLLALEVAQPGFSSWFSALDPNEPRKALLADRRKALQSHDDYLWPTVMFSDAHSLAAPRQAASASRITRLKMDRPSFAAIRIAFLDASSRVRTEAEIPGRVPHIVGIKTEGGFLGT